MKTLYIDCSAGVSSDMLLAALKNIAKLSGINVSYPSLTHQPVHSDSKMHGRTLWQVSELINSSKDATSNAKLIALNIFSVLAKAEAAVHGKTPDTVHFHEVGRNQAIENVLGIGAALDALEIDTAPDSLKSGSRILISPIYDGTGFINCAHGRIPVPVPAVKAMESQCPQYEFLTAEEVHTEMVTPSGLATLIGIGARPADEELIYCYEKKVSEKAKNQNAPDPVMNQKHRIVCQTTVFGTRDVGRGGLTVTLLENLLR